jgi:alpha-1,3-rhamnosyl/mannosyltransferase
VTRAAHAIHVGIDLTALRPRHTGVDRYLVELARHVGTVDPGIRYTIFVNRADRPLFEGRLPPNVCLRSWGLRPRPARFVLQHAVLPAACAALGVDVLHSPSFLMPAWRGRPRHLLTVHDMTFFSLPEVHTRLHRSRAFRSLVLGSICRADLLNVPSAATRDALRVMVPEMPSDRLRVIPYGISSTFQPAGTALDRAGSRWIPPAPYILSLGTIEPRKNAGLLLEAYRRLVHGERLAEHLVLAGERGHGWREAAAAIRRADLQGRVHAIGFVPEPVLPALYRGARLFVYPSLAEGFGFPPLEAMACGVPVIASAGSSLGENLAGAADLVPPGDAAGLAVAMCRMLRDEDHRQARIREGLARAAAFRWEDTARRVVACYRELGEAGVT